MDDTELKKENNTWNLASDEKLLELLQKITSDFTDHAQACITKVDQLGFAVSESEIGLRNTFNEFLMLGNSQFIENVRFRTFLSFLMLMRI